MDYMLCNALGYNTEGLETALTFYDVNYQYNKYLLHQVKESPYLAIPFGMEIILGIGLWYVHGHQDQCHMRYTLNFIMEEARINGEIMEMLWAPLNIIYPSCQEWHEQETAANASQAEDPSSIDIYEVWLEKDMLGAATWIASSITIEESQIALAMDLWKLGRHPSKTQELSIAHHRVALQHTINEFNLAAE
ncbi:hypothetical protein BDR06DRAFT_975188 [Suillus hirtellus]|nr:hypothetical protein BDR06DRAFT_975188 [Suillus hirtellus]